MKLDAVLMMSVLLIINVVMFLDPVSLAKNANLFAIQAIVPLGLIVLPEIIENPANAGFL